MQGIFILWKKSDGYSRYVTMGENKNHSGGVFCWKCVRYQNRQPQRPTLVVFSLCSGVEREKEREGGRYIYRKTLLVYKNEHVHKESIKRRKWAQDTGQLVVMWAQATELKLVSVLEQLRYISPDSTAIYERYFYSISIQTKQRSEDREPVSWNYR